MPCGKDLGRRHPQADHAVQRLPIPLPDPGSYGRPGKGNDKGNVEGLVGYARRNFMVPIPQFATWEGFNGWLEEQCRKRQRDRLRGESETIGERLPRDLTAMRSLPPSLFDACDHVSAKVTAQSLVRYKTNDYSVPVAYGHTVESRSRAQLLETAREIVREHGTGSLT